MGCSICSMIGRRRNNYIWALEYEGGAYHMVGSVGWAVKFRLAVSKFMRAATWWG